MSIFKIEKKWKESKFSCIFLNLDYQTQSWTSDMFDLLKSNKEPTQFFYLSLIFFPKLVKESNITSEVFSFANAVGNQEHTKNYSNGNYNYHLHLLLVFHVFLVDLAIAKRKYFRCSRL